MICSWFFPKPQSMAGKCNEPLTLYPAIPNTCCELLMDFMTDCCSLFVSIMLKLIAYLRPGSSVYLFDWMKFRLRWIFLFSRQLCSSWSSRQSRLHSVCLLWFGCGLLVEGGPHGCLLLETKEPETLTHLSLSSGERDWLPFCMPGWKGMLILV